VERGRLGAAFALAIIVPVASPASPEGPALGADRITQKQITSGLLSRDEIRLAGRRMFITPFNKLDGYGDGPPGATPEERRQLGGRTTLQGNGTFLRVNGLDARTCLECHSIVSAATIPFTFGVGGVGGVNNTAIGFGGASFINTDDDPAQMTDPDNSDLPTTGRRNINGRVINPPFVFGVGGVELLGKEMTRDLQSLRASISGRRNGTVNLVTKGVSFGTLSTDAHGNVLTDAQGRAVGVEGIDADPQSPTFLVVQPFGRKGDNDTTRTFDVGAFQFHFGMQPVEAVGEGVDGDGDGVADEVLVGELSALSVFLATTDRPQMRMLQDPAERRKAERGARIFESIGCADCHRPVLATQSPYLTFSFPQIAQDPDANVYYQVDLTQPPMNFPLNRQGGINVPLFADLKRHNMGPGLAEFNGDAIFTTARLWGVADTAPYLHDGRAFTLMDAILTHGGEGSEAEPAVDRFKALPQHDRDAVIAFLGTLHTPENPGADLDKLAKGLAKSGQRGD
jgi:Di-haem oxidoreductase, putative peroxidase